MKLHVLVVEDDDRIRSALELALEDEGWDVTGAPSAEEALTLLGIPAHETAEPPARSNGNGEFDIALVDLMLPGIDGFELCRLIRRHSDIPIIMETARDDTHDVVGGLEAGADDYVTKPFSPKELSARMRALMRRTRLTNTGGVTWVVDDLEIFPDKRVVKRAGKEVRLTKTEFLLLCELAEADGTVLSRQDLLHSVWERDEMSYGRLVDVHIRRLRVKIEDDPAQPRFIQTARGMGYKLHR